jgi:hypothetical protein
MTTPKGFLDSVLRASAVGLLLAGAPALEAQQRLLLPEGTVLTVRMNDALSSASTSEGATFTTTVMDSVRVEGYTVIPKGSTIEGRVTLLRRATSRQSGIIGVEFNRLVLPRGAAIAIDGKLTSTDPAERRQIEAQGNAQVVFVGGRQGTGAAIGGIANAASGDPVAGLIGTLGNLLSRGADVTVPVNTALAVQLERGLMLTGVGGPARNADAFTIYTSAEMIRAAQTALRAQNYYRGAINGVFNEDVQRALFEYQIDHGILATGNLDGRTAQALALQTASAMAMTPAEAAMLRRNAQNLTGRWRSMIGITEVGRLDPRRHYQTAELELHFALSAFSDNASLYEQMVRVSGNADGLVAAGQALLSAAKRVDAALATAPGAGRLNPAWSAIGDQLLTLDPDYR